MNAMDIIRERVDALHTQDKLDVPALLSGLPEAGSAAKERDADLHQGGALHRCPWHTCAATRHN